MRIRIDSDSCVMNTYETLTARGKSMSYHAATIQVQTVESDTGLESALQT
jgi:hypothetical protein